MLAALAFVPLPDVIDAFESVADEFPLDAQEVIDYCEETVFLKTTKLPALCHPKRFF